MQNVSFEEVVERVIEQDPRFHPDAYDFVREALDYTQQRVAGMADVPRHVSGQQLLEGIRLFALREFGPMAVMVFESWGVTRCEDFGEIVFNLVDYQFLKKTDKDCRDDFKQGYDFEEAFLRPFLPASRLRAPKRATTLDSEKVQ